MVAVHGMHATWPSWRLPTVKAQTRTGWGEMVDTINSKSTAVSMEVRILSKALLIFCRKFCNGKWHQ